MEKPVPPVENVENGVVNGSDPCQDGEVDLCPVRHSNLNECGRDCGVSYNRVGNISFWKTLENFFCANFAVFALSAKCSLNFFGWRY
jgi:hypothetical protein